MNQFVAEFPNIEVASTSINSFLHCMRRGKDLRLELLEKYNLLEDNKDWFPLQDWLNAFKDISEKLGEMNLFLTGIALVNNSPQFANQVSLYEALTKINISYHLKHRLNGEVMYNQASNQLITGIGNYTLVQYDKEAKQAIVTCDTPYPSKFEEGILYELTKKFKPDPQTPHLIKQDSNKDRRNKGGKSCTFIINW